MSKLIVNAWVNGQGWGPGFGNAENVPAEVAAEIDDPAAWDEAPSTGDAPDSTPKTSGADSGPTVPERSLADALADVPDDKTELLAFRDEHDLDANGQLGVDNLRAALAEAIGS